MAYQKGSRDDTVTTVSQLPAELAAKDRSITTEDRELKTVVSKLPAAIAADEAARHGTRKRPTATPPIAAESTSDLFDNDVTSVVAPTATPRTEDTADGLDNNVTSVAPTPAKTDETADDLDNNVTAVARSIEAPARLPEAPRSRRWLVLGGVTAIAVAGACIAFVALRGADESLASAPTSTPTTPDERSAPAVAPEPSPSTTPADQSITTPSADPDERAKKERAKKKKRAWNPKKLFP